MYGHEAQLHQGDSRPSLEVGYVPPHTAFPAVFAHTAARSFTWWPELGFGFYPVTAGVAPYDANYFERYAEMGDTPTGRALNMARCNLVERFTKGAVVDIGIGAGTFIDWRLGTLLQPTYGFDVNPAGVEWLKRKALFLNPYECESVDAITCWDVLEHIPSFETLINRVKRFVFVSIPIFRDVTHARMSKHFRPDEHCWYFTEYGLKGIFSTLGFDCVEANVNEVQLGREDVMSFVFKRRAADERYHPEWTLDASHHDVLRAMRGRP